MRLLIDTDVGIDDAIALLMALDATRRGEAQIEAITAVAGNAGVDDVAVNLCRTMDAAGASKDIPVYLGAKEALVKPLETNQPPYHGFDGFNDVAFDAKPDMARIKPDEVAADAIRRIVNQNPGEITLVALGPLTNLAIAFSLDPSIPTKLKDLIIMGGNSEGIGNITPTAEFNFYADPEAAAIVFRLSCPGSILLVPFELCRLHSIIDKTWRWDVLARVDSPQARLMNYVEEKWKAHEFISMCDQKAMAVAMNKEKVVTRQKAYSAKVELDGANTRGMLVLDRRSPTVNSTPGFALINVVERIDVDLVKEYLLRAFGHNCE